MFFLIMIFVNFEYINIIQKKKKNLSVCIKYKIGFVEKKLRELRSWAKLLLFNTK